MASIKRELNKAFKKKNIETANKKVFNRYNLIRDEIKDIPKDDLVVLLKDKKMSKTDRIAYIHTIRKLTDAEKEEDSNSNALSGEDNSSSEKKDKISFEI